MKRTKIDLSGIQMMDSETGEVEFTGQTSLTPPVGDLPPPASRTPPPATGTAWWTCPNEGICRFSGFAATGMVVDKHTPTKKSCRRCHGAGHTLNEDPCTSCDGRGWNRATKHFHSHPICPGCGSDMVLISEGAYPAGYPRLDLGGSDGDDYAKGGNSGSSVRWRWHPPSDG